MRDARRAPVLTLHRFLSRVARRIKLVAAADGALTVVSVALAVLLAGVAVRPAAGLVRYASVVFAALGLAALAVALGVLLRALCRRRHLGRAALLVERRHPDLRSDLTSALELARLEDAEYRRYGTSRSLVRAVERRAAEAARRLDPAAVVDAARLRQRLWLPGALAGLVGLVGLVAPGALADSARALVDPFAFVPPDVLALEVAPGDASVLRGTPVTVRIRTLGRVPERVEVVLLADVPPDVAARAAAEGWAPSRQLAARPAGGGLFTVGPFTAEQSLRYRVQAGSVTSRVYRLVVEDPPEAGRIAATYHYPAYLGLADRTVEGGTIEAYLGTEVRLAVTANKPVVAGRLVFDNGSAQPLEVEAPPGSGTGLSGAFVVTGEGGYRVVLADRAGFETPEPIRYEIRVVPDSAPTAEIVRPGEDLTVDQGDTVRVEWRAGDDVAVGAVDLVLDAGGGEQRVPLWRPAPEGRRDRPAPRRDGAAVPPGDAGAARAGGDGLRDARTRVSGRHDWRLAALRLPSGARVAYHVEARDTDVISGPKRGVSSTYYLEVRSREKDHEELRADQREIADALLDALGDQLERHDAALAGRRAEAEARGHALEQRLAEVRRRLEEALARTAEDPLVDATQLFDMNLLRSHLEAVGREAVEAGVDPSRQPPVTRELEQLAAFADEIGRRGEMEDVVRRGRELMRAQTELLDRLERQEAGTLDPRARAELERALAAIEEGLRRLAEQLAGLPQSLPDEFMNSEAMEGLAMSELAERLDQLREAVRQGDLARARELARQLAAELNRMMAALGGAAGDSQQAAGGDQMARQLARRQNRLAELAREQRELVARTEELDRRAADRQARAQEREWGAFERRARERLDAAGERLRETAQRPVEGGTLDAASFFRNRAIQESLREARERLDARQARELARSLAQARDLLRRSPAAPAAPEEAAELDRLVQELSRLGGSLRSHLTPEERTAMRELAERQRRLGEATEALAGEVADLQALLPMLDPRLGRNLREAVPFMEDATGRLGDRDPRGALPPEREAQKRLGEAQQAMQEARQQMAQRGRMRGMSAAQMMLGRGPGGIMPGGPDDRPMPRADLRDGGRAGASTRDFKLPGREDYQVPRVYREQVIEALKEPIPDAYRRKVERYFKGLTE